jgi:hypothetical protein
MTRPSATPADPEIFHITHASNLPSILRAGALLSDSRCQQLGVGATNIGYRHIKERRLRRQVPKAAGGCLGDYVPFNFCPRSVMLYVIKSGHDDYRDGQERVIHLRSTVRTAVAVGRPWVFTDRHAEVAHALYLDDLARLDEIAWEVMPLQFWSGGKVDPEVKELRQAEFLVHEFIPWGAIQEIGVMSAATAREVQGYLGPGGPPVNVRTGWYY